MSMRPKRSTTSAATFRAASPLDNSAASAVNSECEKSLSLMDRDTPTTCAPAARSASVTNVPRPPFAPVTIATFPVSALMLFPRRPCHAELGIQRQAAAGEDRLSGDVGRVVRREKGEYRGDLVRLGGMADRDVALDFPPRFRIVDPRLIDRGDDRARTDCVDANAAIGVFEGERF